MNRFGKLFTSASGVRAGGARRVARIDSAQAIPPLLAAATRQVTLKVIQ